MADAEKQNEIRREQKRKQRHGRGKKQVVNELENVKTSRHATGKFIGSTEEAIKTHFQKNPEVPITTEFFRNLLKEGKIEVDCPDSHTDVTISSDEIESGIWLKTVTVFTSGGFGVKFKTVGGFNGKPRKVIIL